MENTLAKEPCQCQEKAKRFAEYVRLHANKGKLISWEDELEALKIGVTDFGLTLDQAKGSLYSVVDDRDMTLESNANHHMRAFLAQMGKKGKISKAEFDDAVQIYQKLTHNTLPEPEARKRVKALVESDGLHAKRNGFGSRRWFDKV